MPDTMPPLRVLSYIRSHPWAMEPSAFGAMLEVVQLRVKGFHLTKAEKKSRIEAARRTPGLAMSPAGPGGVAVIPLMGVLTQRADMMRELSGATSCEKFAEKFREAVDDPNVGGIVVHVDSGGGSVFGVQETAAMVAAARGPKPIIAMVNSISGSAAYWIASQCDEVVVAPGGQVGSIGVICCHADFSEMNRMLGVKWTYVTSPEGGFKGEGNPDEPLSQEAIDYMKATANEYYKPFVDAVASGRRVSAKTVREQFGQGRMVTASKAVELGMADRIATLKEVVDGMVPKKQGGGGGRAETSEDRLRSIGANAPQELKDDVVPMDLGLARARVALAGSRRRSVA
jgi:signal peptide peptidase SppA